MSSSVKSSLFSSLFSSQAFPRCSRRVSSDKSVGTFVMHVTGTRPTPVVAPSLSHYFSSTDPDSNAQQTTATTPFPFSLCQFSHYSSPSSPVVLVCVYFFLNLCRPLFSTSSRPKEQSLGSLSTVQGYPFSTSRRILSWQITSGKPTTLTSSFTIPTIRVRLGSVTHPTMFLLPLLHLSCPQHLLFWGGPFHCRVQR